jgi:phosphate transport system permease protein
MLLGSSIAAAIALTWLIFEQFALLSGPAGFVICATGIFLLVYWIGNVQLNGRLVATDRLWAAILAIGALCLAVPLCAVVIFIVSHGWKLLSAHFFVKDQKGLGPLSPVGAGGIGHAVLGTLEQVAVAVIIGAPLGIATAVFLNEVGGPTTRFVRTVVTAMSGLPSIVAGIFVYSVWIVALGQGFSGFAGALALSILLLPSIARTTEEVLKVVPGGLREASTALGAPEWRTVWSVVLPAARAGIVTAVLLGIARIAGETAPLLVTIFGSTYYNANLFHGAQEALPLFIYQHVKLPLASQVQLAYGAALALAIVVFMLFLLARLVSGKRPSWMSMSTFRRAPSQPERSES